MGEFRVDLVVWGWFPEDLPGEGDGEQDDEDEDVKEG